MKWSYARSLVPRCLSHPLSLIAVMLIYGVRQVAIPLMHLHSNDFKHLYAGIHAIWRGEDPYTAPSLLRVAAECGLGDAALNPYVYLPFTGLALGFLKFFSFHTAAHFWFFANHAMIFISGYLFARSLVETFPELRKPESLRAIVCLYLLTMAFSHPLSRNLTAGQLNCVLLLVYLLAFRALQVRRENLGGALLGFGALFKLSPAVFVLLFGLTRRRKALIAMVLSMVLLSLLSIAIAGIRMHLDFFPVLRQMGYGRSTWQEYGATFWKDPWNQSLNSLWTHLVVAGNGVTVAWWAGTQSVANLLTWCSSAVLLALYVWGGLRVARNEQVFRSERSETAGGLSAREASFYQATVLLSLLLPSLMWDHYLVQTIFPFGWLLAHAWVHRRYAQLLILAVALVGTLMPWAYDAERFRTGWGVLLMSVKLYPILVVYVIAIREATCAAKTLQPRLS